MKMYLLPDIFFTIRTKIFSSLLPFVFFRRLKCKRHCNVKDVEGLLFQGLTIGSANASVQSLPAN
jgi:hypothetical protein